MMKACTFQDIFDENVLQKLTDALSVSLRANIRLCRDISALTDSDIKIILGEAPVAGFIVEAPAADAPLSPEHIEDVRTALVLLAEQLSQLGYQTLYLKSLVNSLEDQEALHRKERSLLKDMAEKDYLTGLFNHRKFEEAMEQYSKRTDLSICIISAGANFLKLTNDIFGHESGDIMLKKIAGIMSKLARKGWIVARCGGDEFRVLLPDTKLISAMDYCRRVAHNCKNEHGYAFPLSIALGVAEWQSDRETLQECFTRADEKMYQNKAELKKELHLPDYILERLYDRQILNEDILRFSIQVAGEFSRYLRLPESQVQKITLAARYEDIGMAQLPDCFMIRGQSKTLEEQQMLQGHVTRGYDMARQFEELYQIADIILCCHENWAGNSYPRQLKGKEIPLEARIIRIANNYCYWVVPTAFGTSLSKGAARERLVKYSGDMYDPELVEKFIRFADKNGY